MQVQAVMDEWGRLPVADALGILDGIKAAGDAREPLEEDADAILQAREPGRRAWMAANAMRHRALERALRILAASGETAARQAEAFGYLSRVCETLCDQAAAQLALGVRSPAVCLSSPVYWGDDGETMPGDVLTFEAIRAVGLPCGFRDHLGGWRFLGVDTDGHGLARTDTDAPSADEGGADLSPLHPARCVGGLA